MTLSIKHRFISAPFEVEFQHKMPQALTDPNYADVAFLGYPHRHVGKFRVSIQVFHDDREIEFIQFKRWLQSLYGTGVLEANNQSCEMLSDALAEKIHEKYPGRELKIDVFEDGENGSVTHYKPDFEK